MSSYLLLVAAALGAGLMNSVAGGGSFLTFPALVFTGVPSIIANATSTVALFPGALASAWAYRTEFKGLEIPLKPALLVSIAGGVTGAFLLLFTSQKTFDVIIPWLLLGATLTFALGPRIMKRLKRQNWMGTRTLIAFQFLVGIYGGYFGGAVGIIMLAVWSLAGLRNIHAMNGGRTLLGGVMNAAAVVIFIIAGKVWWLQTSMMLIAAVVGGYVGARIARRVNPAWVRGIIIVVSIVVTAAFFLRS
ncbi:MAG TPA: sulfite exporter TauE/SafE family protein [Terriglobia bacterium]|nr:sulfite exporter TauE/SafE family protein [Terriglobia bacterium]